MDNNTSSFMNYLNNNGLYYYGNIIEELLINLKYNNLILLNGNKGVGKTSLAEHYVKYYMEKNNLNDKLHSTFKLGKTVTSKGFAVKRKDVHRILPKLSYEDTCNFVVNDIVVNAHINLTPRLFFKRADNPEFYEYLEKLEKDGVDQQIDYDILLAKSDSLFYKIFNAEFIDRNSEEINQIFNKAYDDYYSQYFIIFDKVSDKNINSILFSSHELPSNLTIIYTGNISEISTLVDEMAIIQFNSMSPMDYLQNDLLNINFNNIFYLENFEKESFDNLNTIKDNLQYIRVSDNKSLYNILLDELNKLYYILEEENICLSNKNINNILKYMIISWKYEDSPEIFTNWIKYFDFQIVQRIIPLIYSNEDMSIDLIDKLVNFCNDDYSYYRSYSILSQLL